MDEAHVLVVWQVGTNAVYHDYNPAEVAAAIEVGLQWLAGFAADVSKETDAAAMVKFAEERYGKLNVIFNNAGIFPDDDGSVTDTSEETFDLTWIEHVGRYSSPTIFASAWTAKVETHYLGGLRHFRTWEIADMLRQTEDIFRIPADDIQKTTVIYTIVGGRVVFGK